MATTVGLMIMGCFVAFLACLIGIEAVLDMVRDR